MITLRLADRPLLLGLVLGLVFGIVDLLHLGCAVVRRQHPGVAPLLRSNVLFVGVCVVPLGTTCRTGTVRATRRSIGAVLIRPGAEPVGRHCERVHESCTCLRPVVPRADHVR